ncbi:protein MIZU-KUSSEI 1 [Dorcoceras hygrometricum]|uniref:Protein MIZU-KUSSEI 1 n=1 Tax=Dorcoceras hygrometricum TaxID=472368 RepID=A0A2Z7CZJ1_9LAMI|nr:protein MIZU-KUSSEI 1 [Dorcoceras hygrometricum]
MRTLMARNPQDSFSFSRRYFHWKKKGVEDEGEEDMVEILNLNSSSKFEEKEKGKTEEINSQMRSLSLGSAKAPRKKLSVMAVSKLRSALALGKARTHFTSGLGTKVVGTLFGHRRGHVHIAFQEDFKLSPPFLVELATPTSILVKEMASGLVRIALECEKRVQKKGFKLIEEPMWRTYCNGKKCGYAMKRECGPEEWKVLNAIGPISMGAGVLPGPGNGAESDGELMYMRAKFERVVGSKDSEAFYMMNPDGNGGPELSIYLLRV